MPSGHTDRTTINQRKPLTEAQRSMLSTLHGRDDKAAMYGWQQSLCWGELTNGEKNVLRSLCDRGYATTIGADRYYRLTAEGRLVIAAEGIRTGRLT